MIRTRIIVTIFALLSGTHAFQLSTTRVSRSHAPVRKRSALYSLQTEEETKAEKVSPSVEETTEKYGLEAGLFQSLKSSDATSAKSLLAKYGIAYLATSIPLALISFGICYALVDNGVDVGSLLAKVGINAGDTGEKAGTFAIAYAAHKAASPIRFPPTVALTPVVAKLIGKEVDEDASGMGESDQ
ncbi:hypothetical protein ACHAXN_009535 [Cyclotella atomus]